MEREMSSCNLHVGCACVCGGGIDHPGVTNPFSIVPIGIGQHGLHL